MKIKILLFLLLSVLMMSCDRDRKKADEISAPAVLQEELQAWEYDIQLDRGSKWVANKETTRGVNKMSSLIEETSPSGLDNYHLLAEELIAEINILIKECTMEGASHDNLHIFLEPLIIKSAQLEQSVSVEEAAKLTSEIKRHLLAYHKYFI